MAGAGSGDAASVRSSARTPMESPRRCSSPVTGDPSASTCSGAPRGFSRLALEHRVRPTGKLRACFLTSFHPNACGGLGGTFLRLSGDGHGDLLVAGPSGGAHTSGRSGVS